MKNYFHLFFSIFGLLILGAVVYSVVIYPSWLNTAGGLTLLIILSIVGVVSFLANILQIITGVIQLNAIKEGKRKFLSGYKKPLFRIPRPAPTIGQLPSGSRLPYLSNPYFTGREAELRELYGILTAEQSKAQPVVISGMGGCGKTQIVVQFCYLYGRFFEGVHWVQADDPGGLENEIANCGLAMDIQPWPANIKEQVQATIFAWSEKPNRVLILDNLDDPELLRTLLSRVGGVHLIITSRRDTWPSELGVKLEKLIGFSLEESRELLRVTAPRLQEEKKSVIDEISIRLGNLPLALNLAGRYINDIEELSAKKYLDELSEVGNTLKHVSLTEWSDGTPTSHTSSLLATFYLSWERLKGTGKFEKLSRIIFRVSGYCLPGFLISDELLYKSILYHEEIPLSDFKLSLRRLYDLGLLINMEGASATHVLLSEFSLLIEDIPQPDYALQYIVEGTSDVTYNYLESGNPAGYVPLIPHIEKLLPLAEKNNLRKAGSLYSQIGFIYYEMGNLHKAKSYFVKAIEIGNQYFGPEDFITAVDWINMGTVLLHANELDNAKSSLEQARRIFDKHGIDSERVPPFLNNWGALLHQLGRIDEALDYYRRALSIDINTYGMKNPNVVRDFNNLGSLLQEHGEFAGAKECLSNAYAIAKEILKENDPVIAKTGSQYGKVLVELKEYHEAEKVFRESLAIIERNFGINNLNYAITLISFSILFSRRGNYTEHEKLSRQAFNILSDAVGIENPTTGAAAFNLGEALLHQGKTEEAKPCFELSLQIFSKTLPANNINIKKAQNYLQRIRYQKFMM